MSHYEVSKSFEEAFEKEWLAKVDLGDIGEVRRLLGAYGDNLTDVEVIAIRDLCRKFADYAYHWWMDVREERLAEKQHEEDNSSEGPTFSIS
ncbi:hypothetical protein WG908_03250 [Sphingobium sp. AN641]|uniref:hypothetical protein n=1 Tax=Sphingobium sp. AN641 TaxID=3133443 RepID=UPI0030BA60E8